MVSTHIWDKMKGQPCKVCLLSFNLAAHVHERIQGLLELLGLWFDELAELKAFCMSSSHLVAAVTMAVKIGLY